MFILMSNFKKSLCGDKITLEILCNEKINSMKYETDHVYM